MASVSLDELLQKIPSKFSLVMVAAKRARQIKDGAPRLVSTHSVNPVTIALEEINSGKIVLDGTVAHIMDDFGRPIRTQRDALDDLLALSEGEGEVLDPEYDGADDVPDVAALLGDLLLTPVSDAGNDAADDAAGDAKTRSSRK